MFNFIKIRNFNFLEKNPHTSTNSLLIATKKQNGITLIALIITIVILLILAGVVLNLTIGERGIFNIAKNASKNFMDAQNKELSDLDKLYSELKIATGDNSQITVNIEDLKKIIQEEVNSQLDATVDEKINERMKTGVNGISSGSLLLEAINDRTSVTSGENLTSFILSPSSSFSEYFDYNTSNGELTCKQEGWYMLHHRIVIKNTNNNWSSVLFRSMVNGIDLANDYVDDALSSTYNCRNSNSYSVYINQGDKVSVNKTLNNQSATSFHVIWRIYKL